MQDIGSLWYPSPDQKLEFYPKLDMEQTEKRTQNQNHISRLGLMVVKLINVREWTFFSP